MRDVYLIYKWCKEGYNFSQRGILNGCKEEFNLMQSRIQFDAKRNTIWCKEEYNLMQRGIQFEENS